MGSLLDAFGIYSNYRRSKTEVAPIGADGFLSPSQLMFYQDKYFIRLQVTGSTAMQKDVFLACARAISQKLPSNKRRPQEIEILRIPVLVPGSERYIPKSLLGYTFFRRGIIADVILEGKQIQFFVVTDKDQAASREAFAQYRSYLQKEGQNLQEITSSNLHSLTAVDPLYGEVLAGQFDSYIIGAIRLKDVSTANKSQSERIFLRLWPSFCAALRLFGHQLGHTEPQ
jgi:hypothetical protein